MVTYLFEFICCSGLFYALYRLVIEGRVAHRSARMYIIYTTLLSAIIPILELPIYPAESTILQLPIATTTTTATTNFSDVTSQGVDWRVILTYIIIGIYAAIVALNLLRLTLRLREVFAIRKASKLSFYEAYTLAENNQIQEPFSFWRTIYLNGVFEGTAREAVIAHEYSHICHRHSAERITIEVLRSLFWFNPFIWLAGNSLVEVQEWEADKDVIDKGYDVGEYRLLVFQQLYGYYPEVTCGLKSQTSKNRFLMMTNFKKGKFSPLRLCAAIPMIAGMVLVFGAVRAESQTPTETPKFQKVEVSAQPSSTETAALLQQFCDYAKMNIRYPADTKAEGVDGQVVVEFAVNLVNGSAEVRKVHRTPDKRLTEEVERVIKTAKWEPIEAVADRPHPKVILTFDFIIDGKSDMSKFKNKINNIAVKTFAE